MSHCLFAACKTPSMCKAARREDKQEVGDQDAATLNSHDDKDNDDRNSSTCNKSKHHKHPSRQYEQQQNHRSLQQQQQQRQEQRLSQLQLLHHGRSHSIRAFAKLSTRGRRGLRPSSVHVTAETCGRLQTENTQSSMPAQTSRTRCRKSLSRTNKIELLPSGCCGCEV